MRIQPAFAPQVDDPQLAIIFNRARTQGAATIHMRNALDAVRAGLSSHAENEIVAALKALEARL